MLYRVAAAAACVLLLAGCQQGPGTSAAGVTAPSSYSADLATPSALGVKPGQDLPFSGAVTGGLTFGPNIQNCPAGHTGVTDATGQALHMGRVTYHTEQCVNPATGAIDGRVLVLTAANGDELHGTFQGQTVSGLGGPVGSRIQVQATFVFNGGTGRFERATGTAGMRAAMTHEASFPWPGRWEWDGKIRY